MEAFFQKQLTPNNILGNIAPTIDAWHSSKCTTEMSNLLKDSNMNVRSAPSNCRCFDFWTSFTDYFNIFIAGYEQVLLVHSVLNNNSRQVFRILSNIYDGAFLRK